MNSYTPTGHSRSDTDDYRRGDTVETLSATDGVPKAVHSKNKETACVWCGRPIPDTGKGRTRKYCRQSCRQRAYEQRSTLKDLGLPETSVVLSEAEIVEQSERQYILRCAAEDIATAITERASVSELEQLATELVELAREAERFR